VSRDAAAALFVLVASSMLTLAATVQAQEAQSVRQANLVIDDAQVLRASIAYHDVVDAPTITKLRGGLPTTIAMRAYVFRDNGGPALAATFKACKVVYDLWDDLYRLEITQAGRPNEVTNSLTIEGVLRRCAETDRLAIVSRSLLSPPGSYYLAVIVEVNPVSPEMLERIKRWVSRPTGTSTTAPGDALFGSFVGLFVARVGTADRQITFRTQSVPL
jgi:hypothetical protein